MDVTSQLLKVYLVDKQLQGLQSRLKAAERFFNEQSTLLGQIEGKRGTLESQVKQVSVGASGQEGEMKRLDARMAVIREQMNSAKTNKEYKAFLTELNTLKAERDRFEQGGLEQLSKVDELKKQLAELDAARAERQKMQSVAAKERDERQAEIQGRLEELKGERAKLAAGVPKDAISKLERLIETRGEDAMAPIDIIDRKRHEFHCGACQMALPVDAITGIIAKGSLTTCVSCGCLLYVREDDVKMMLASKK